MKTLLERLKPEYLEILENEIISFPYLIADIKAELKSKNYFTDIKLGTAYPLCDLCKVSFGLVEIDSLFNKD